MSSLDEFGLIEALKHRLPAQSADVLVGIGDDAAVVRQTPGDGLLTSDAMVEGVHFLATTMSWFDVGYKCVAASISDIAAMGGTPRHVLMTLVLPKSFDADSILQMYDGVAAVCQQFGCSVVGGDVVSTGGPLVLNSTVTGVVPQGQVLLRSGAQPGDVVFVTGTVGDAAAGLTVLLDSVSLAPDDAIALRQAHQRPQPQVAAGALLRQVGASACDDVSDGLASELNEIARASGVRLRIDAARVPISPATRNLARFLRKEALDFAWYGGEDYQLVGTAPPFAFAGALAQARGYGVTLQQIGRVEQGDSAVVANFPDGRLELIEPRGFNHFRTSSRGN